MSAVATEQLKSLIERLLELQPAAERYKEAENLLIGLMLTAEVSEIVIPGKGRAALANSPDRRSFGLVVEPDRRPIGAIIEITPLKWLARQ